MLKDDNYSLLLFKRRHRCYQSITRWVGWQPHQRKSVLSSPVTRSYSQGGPGIESIAVDGEVKLNMVGASSLRGHLSANYLTQCLRSLDLDAKMGGGLVVS